MRAWLWGQATSTVAEDDLLRDLINVASDEIEGFCRRRFHRATDTVEVHDGDGTSIVRLRRPPLVNVSAIQIGRGDDVRTLEASSWMCPQTDEQDGRVILTGDVFPVGEGNVRVTLTGGYETIPSRINLAAREYAVAFYRMKGADPRIVRETRDGAFQDRTVTNAYGLPDSVMTLVLGYKLPLALVAGRAPLELSPRAELAWA